MTNKCANCGHDKKVHVIRNNGVDSCWEQNKNNKAKYCNCTNYVEKPHEEDKNVELLYPKNNSTSSSVAQQPISTQLQDIRLLLFLNNFKKEILYEFDKIIEQVKELEKDWEKQMLEKRKQHNNYLDANDKYYKLLLRNKKALEEFEQEIIEREHILTIEFIINLARKKFGDK